MLDIKRTIPVGTTFGLVASMMLATAAGAASLHFTTSTDSAGDEGRICIVEGANICPPPDLELVTPCITTGMLAGSTCPTAAEIALPRGQRKLFVSR